MTPEIFTIKSFGAGSLSIMAKPEPDDHMEKDISGVAAAGIEKIVSLLESHEYTTLGLENEESITEKYDMEFMPYPMLNRAVPPIVSDFSDFTKKLFTEISDGRHVLVHCHGGIGRSGMVAAAVLMHDGATAEEALELVNQKRGVPVPDTQEQTDWVVNNASAIVGN